MADSKKIVETVLLPLQLILGIWQTMKTTTVWVVIHCTIEYLLDCCRFPFTDYKHLRKFEGRVFKKVIIHATAAGDVPMKMKMKKQKDPHLPQDENLRSMNAESLIGGSVSVKYLGQKFVLDRMDGDKMQVRTLSEQKDGELGKKIPSHDGPVYYVTDKMWETMKYVGKVADEGSVFVKNHKELRGKVVTGAFMEFEEVLDSVILDNRAVVRLDQDYFLPVNLLMPEDKVLTTLNLVSLFVQAFKNIHWLIPALITFASALLVCSEYLRNVVYSFYFINIILVRGLQFLCDLLPYRTRRSVYSWCSWVDRFKPRNDFHSRIVKGDVEMVIAGGAKFDSQCQIKRINFDYCLGDNILYAGGPYLLKCTNCDSKCGSKCDSVYIEWIFHNTKCSLKLGHLASKGSRPSLKECKTSILCGEGNGGPGKAITFYTSSDTQSAISVDMETGKKSMMPVKIHTSSVDIDCSAEEATKLFIFAHYMAKLKTGSLRSYDRYPGIVCVRRFVESINAYVRSGYPPLYKLEMKNVVVR